MNTNMPSIMNDRDVQLTNHDRMDQLEINVIEHPS